MASVHHHGMSFFFCSRLQYLIYFPIFSRIQSAPEQDFVSVHVRIVGDWTGELKALVCYSLSLSRVESETKQKTL